MKSKNKRSQEEMVGFALIIILVSVILLVFLGFSLKKPQKEQVESYEIESFIQAFLQHTTDCRDNLEYLPVKKLIYSCYYGEKCLDERDACEALNITISEILKESWKTENSPVRGYVLNITSQTESILMKKQGNITRNYKGSVVYLPKDIDILFSAYY